MRKTQIYKLSFNTIVIKREFTDAIALVIPVNDIPVPQGLFKSGDKVRVTLEVEKS
jgi:hypothetical protein